MGRSLKELVGGGVGVQETPGVCYQSRVEVKLSGAEGNVFPSRAGEKVRRCTGCGYCFGQADRCETDDDNAHLHTKFQTRVRMVAGAAGVARRSIWKVCFGGYSIRYLTVQWGT